MPSDITVVVPSCNRGALLHDTLRCLVPHLERYRMPVLVGENEALASGVCRAVDELRARLPGLRVELLDLTEPGSRPSRPRTLRAVDALYARVETPFIFHCEDDWWLSEEDFIAPSRAILEAFPEVTIVRLTGNEQRPLPDPEKRFEVVYGPDRTARFHYARYGGPDGIYGAFTFHPGLRRREDYERCFGAYAPFGREEYVAENAQALGHREAILETVHARHGGAGESVSTLDHTGAQEASFPGIEARQPPRDSPGRTTGVDAGHAGVYRLSDVGLRIDRSKPVLVLFHPEARVDEALSADRALQMWLALEGCRPEVRSRLDPEAERLYCELTDPVYLLYHHANPQHVLQDVLFAAMLAALDGRDAVPPRFPHFVDARAGRPLTAEAHWSLFAHAACGMVDPTRELFRGSRAQGRLLAFRQLVVPRFMRHRFGHDWPRPSEEPALDYIDTSRPYPLAALEALRERLVRNVLGLPVTPWPKRRNHERFARVLILDRQGARRRRWRNAEAGVELLRQRFGDRFEAIDHVSRSYEQLPPQAQAALFHGAEVVISPHGGALANIVFCRPGTRILELSDETGPFGWTSFARRLGMRLRIARPATLQGHCDDFETTDVELVTALEPLLGPG